MHPEDSEVVVGLGPVDAMMANLLGLHGIRCVGYHAHPAVHNASSVKKGRMTYVAATGIMHDDYREAASLFLLHWMGLSHLPGRFARE